MGSCGRVAGAGPGRVRECARKTWSLANLDAKDGSVLRAVGLEAGEELFGLQLCRTEAGEVVVVGKIQGAWLDVDGERRALTGSPERGVLLLRLDEELRVAADPLVLDLSMTVSDACAFGGDIYLAGVTRRGAGDDAGLVTVGEGGDWTAEHFDCGGNDAFRACAASSTGVYCVGTPSRRPRPDPRVRRRERCVDRRTRSWSASRSAGGCSPGLSWGPPDAMKPLA